VRLRCSPAPCPEGCHTGAVKGEQVISAPDDAVLPLPRQRAADLAALAVAGLYVPAGPGPEPIAGDSLGVVRLDDGLIGLFVGTSPATACVPATECRPCVRPRRRTRCSSRGRRRS
jgi:hypothetical protein